MGGYADGRRYDVERSALATRTLLMAIRVYQLLLSPLFAGHCRFMPSCSHYAAEAVRRHGALRGSWLALCRIARCHPLARAGYDPVPETPPHRAGRGGDPGTPPHRGSRDGDPGTFGEYRA